MSSVARFRHFGNPHPVGADEAAVVPWRGANPDYPPYACRADEVHVVGKVVWKFTRA